MKYSLAIFDLDGTILDTLCDLTDSLNHVITSYGFEARTADEVKSFLGDGFLMLIKRAVAPFDDESVILRMCTSFSEYYASHCDIKTKPYDGIIGLFEALKQHGVKIAVVSNKNDYQTKLLCKKYFADLIDVAIGRTDSVPAKPDPTSVNTVMEQLGIKRHETVFIGDSDVDIRTAENAGIASLSVSWGFRTMDFLKAHNAHKIIAGINDLLSEFL